MKVGEECDDGNSVVNDGCTNCVLDAGWLVHNYKSVIFLIVM